MATSSKSGSDAGAKEVQATVDKANEQGYIGVTVDQTPNEAYTVEGVIAGDETPEATPSKDPDAVYAGDKPLDTGKG